MVDGAECPKSNGVPGSSGGGVVNSDQIRSSLSKQKAPAVARQSGDENTPPLFGAQRPSAVQFPHLQELLLRPSTVSG